MISRELLQKFRDGRCTPEELALIQSYFNQPDKSALEDMLKEDWQDFELTKDEALRNAASSAQEQVWNHISSHLEIQQATPEKNVSLIRWSMVAASLTLLLVFGIGYYKNKTHNSPQFAFEKDINTGTHWITRENKTGKKVKLQLSDGTLVVLSDQSKLYYPDSFTGNLRQVKLTGEAFFAVHRDTLHPFTIHTNAIKVKVLGTSFTVSEKTRTLTEVAVQSGKVMVASLKSQKEIFLGPNEKVTQDNKAGVLTKTLVELPEIINKQITPNFEFDDQPVAKVFELLESAYQVKIAFDATVFTHCRITARLTDQPLYTKLDMICASIGAHYRLQDAQIVIEGPGCVSE